MCTTFITSTKTRQIQFTSVGVWSTSRSVLVLSTSTPNIEKYQNYRPNRNSFRNYFRKDTFQGQRVDWKPSLPYYHLTPDYGHYFRLGKEACLDPGPPEL